MAAFLAIGIASFIGLLILGGAAIITIIEEENIQEEDIVKCFPSLEGTVRIANERFSFIKKTCDFDMECVPGDDEENCDCFFKISLDGKEEFSYRVTKDGVPDQYYDLHYSRSRNEPLKTLIVRFTNTTLSKDLVFDSDLVSIIFFCEEDQLPSASCPRIIVQKIRENYRKLRSCSKHGLIWDINDIE